MIAINTLRIEIQQRMRNKINERERQYFIASAAAVALASPRVMHRFNNQVRVVIRTPWLEIATQVIVIQNSELRFRRLTTKGKKT